MAVKFEMKTLSCKREGMKLEDYDGFLRQFGDFIFIEDKPEPADIIFVPGNGFPQMSENAARLWKEGYAPYILPSGRYSILKGEFTGTPLGNEKYPEKFETECEFISHILVKHGVDENKILKDDQATFTYENAVNSRKITDAKGMNIRKAIICCKASHARRCKLYYQLMFPEAKIMICPSDVGLNRENWFLTEEGREEILGEMERCGKQFHEIFRELMGSFEM